MAQGLHEQDPPRGGPGAPRGAVLDPRPAKLTAPLDPAVLRIGQPVRLAREGRAPVFGRLVGWQPHAVLLVDLPRGVYLELPAGGYVEAATVGPDARIKFTTQMGAPALLGPDCAVLRWPAAVQKGGRKDPRLPVALSARFRRPDAVQGQVLDLSTAGARVQVGEPLEPQACVSLRLELPLLDGIVPLQVEGEVRWRRDTLAAEEAGVRFFLDGAALALVTAFVRQETFRHVSKSHPPG